MKATGQMDNSLDNRPDFVDIQQAAKTLDLSVDALRKRIARGTIEATKENGHWYVQILDNVQTSPDNVQFGPNNVQTSAEDQVDGKELAIAAQDARIASLESQLQAKDAQIDQLHRLLATTALNAAPARPWWKIWG